jgi:hypothetical protein
MANILGPDYIQIGGRYFGTLTNEVQRCEIAVSTGSKFDIIFTMTGSNWSLGTTDKRYLKALVSRRYAGSLNIVELEGNGARWTGTFQSSGLGVLAETTSASSCILQLHNSYSQGSNSGLTIEYELVSGGTGQIPNTIQTHSGVNYTANNIF